MTEPRITYRPTVAAAPELTPEERGADARAERIETEPVEMKGRLLVVDTGARLSREHLGQIARALGLVVLRRDKAGFEAADARRLSDAFPELLVRLRSEASPAETSAELVDEVGEVVDRVLAETLGELRSRDVDDDRRAARIAQLTTGLSEALRSLKFARGEHDLARLSARVEQLEAERAALREENKP